MGEDIPKIDAHIHLTPDDVIRNGNRGYDGKFIVNGAAIDYIEVMRKIQYRKKAFIMPFNDPYMLSMEFTVEAVHNNLLKIGQAYEGKFYCFADLDIRRNIEETLRRIGIVFLKIRFSLVLNYTQLILDIQ